MRWQPSSRRSRVIRSPGPEAELALRHARETANPTALAAALFAYGYGPDRRRPRRGARRIRREHRALPPGREPHHVRRRPSSTRRACASAPATFPTRRVTSAKESSDPTRPALALTFYSGVWWGIEILIRLDHLEQAAVFDGIASTGLTPEYRTFAGTATDPPPSRHRIGTRRLRTRAVRRRVPDRRGDDLRPGRRVHPPTSSTT